MPASSPEFDPDLAAARSVLAAFGHDPAGCEIERPREASTGFSGALILRVRSGDQSWSLRRWPLEGLPRPRLLGLHRFLRHLGESGIDVIAVPSVTADGESLVRHSEHDWQMEPWMPGRADFHRDPSDQRLCSVMHALAEIHRTANRYDCPTADREWFARQTAATSPACVERLRIIRQWSPSRCREVRRRVTASAPGEFRRLAMSLLHDFAIARDPIQQELVALNDVSVPLHPCLRDVWHDHLLFSGNRVTGIVDPSAARTESVASDLSRLLGSLLGDERPRWKTALEAYDRVRPLSTDERRLIRALDHSSVLLSGLTWIDRYLQGQIADESWPQVLPRLETIRRRLQRLARSG